jgi:uncharacterized protein YndB with AHSA1/START domain
MTSVERTGVIDAPRDLVWTALAEFDAISDWAPDVDHSCLMTTQPDGVGATRRIQTARATIVETVTTWDPPGTLAYRITGLPPVLRDVTNTWRLTPSGDSTTVSLVTSIDAGPRPPQQLIARLAAKRFAAASERMIDGLARHLATTNGVAS